MDAPQDRSFLACTRQGFAKPCTNMRTIWTVRREGDGYVVGQTWAQPCIRTRVNQLRKWTLQSSRRTRAVAPGECALTLTGREVYRGNGAERRGS